MGNPLLPVAEELFVAFRKSYKSNITSPMSPTDRMWDDLPTEVKQIWIDVAREAVSLSPMLVEIAKVVK